MSSNTQPSLPTKRAFVVQHHADADLEHGQWQGRVEHLVSYQATHFHSLEELQAFMVRMLTTNRSADEAEKHIGGVPDLEAAVHTLLSLENFRRQISTSGTPPVPDERRSS